MSHKTFISTCLILYTLKIEEHKHQLNKIKWCIYILCVYYKFDSKSKKKERKQRASLAGFWGIKEWATRRGKQGWIFAVINVILISKQLLLVIRFQLKSSLFAPLFFLINYFSINKTHIQTSVKWQDMLETPSPYLLSTITILFYFFLVIFYLTKIKRYIIIFFFHVLPIIVIICFLNYFSRSNTPFVRS